jgi:hypothetical protein
MVKVLPTVQNDARHAAKQGNQPVQEREAATPRDESCSLRPAQNVAETRKCLLNRVTADRFTALNVTVKSEQAVS